MSCGAEGRGSAGTHLRTYYPIANNCRQHGSVSLRPEHRSRDRAAIRETLPPNPARPRLRRAWWRGSAGVPISCSPEAVAAGAIGRGHVAEPERVRGDHGDACGGLFALPGHDVEDHVGRVDAVAERFLAAGFDRRKAAHEHGGQDTRHPGQQLV